MRRTLSIIATSVLCVSAAVWATMAPDDEPAIPTAPVHRGRVEVTVRVTGEIRASRSVQVFTPPAGGTLTIVALASTGAALGAGDTIVEFDSADQVFALEQARYDLALAEQEIVKAEVQAAVQAAEDEVALLEARYAVRRAELDASGNELIGVTAPQILARGEVAGLPTQDRNNLIYVPTAAAILRLEDNSSQFRDEIDGAYIRLRTAGDVNASGAIVRGVLDANHRGAGDYVLIVPAELLAEQQRTKRLFDIVMVALASISLLVGGIGIMNIMLASVLERTPEIGLRRAIGARRVDIIRQFVLETTLIAVTGGIAGLVRGAVMSRMIASLAGWSTIVTPGSLVLSLSVSVVVGLVSGVYPATRASRLDPVQALHYE